jgi:hypothetical protein
MNIFERILEIPENFRITKKIFYIGLAVIAFIEIAVIYLLHLGHGHFWFEDLPAFGAVYGFISCVLIIFVSKFLGHKWLMKGEDYYD